jgi:site-specific DNA recombinase
LNKALNYIIDKVAIYSRKSRDDETEEALRKQLGILINLCEENNWKYDVYKEVGSSQDKHRPEYNKLKNKIQDKEYDAIVVTDQDRLTRTQGEFEELQALLQEYKVLLVTDKKIFDYNNEGDAFEGTFYAFIAKMEYEQTKKRLIRGKRESARNGNWVGGKTPVGYKYDHKTKKLVPDENAHVIKKIYEFYLSGMSSTEIARQFELEGILTPTGTAWNKARISVILSNPVYKGTVVYGKTKVSKVEKKPSGAPRQFKADESQQIIIDNAHEAIVFPEDWETARAIREGRLTKPPSARIGKVIFTSLIRCSLCGRTHSFQRRKGKELRVTSCQTRHYAEDGETYTVCPNKGVRLDHFEQIFFFMFEDYVKALEQYLDEVRANIKKDVANPADEKTALEAQIKRIEAGIKKVQRGFIAEIYSEEEAQKEIKQLKAQKEHVQAQVERLNTKSQDEQIDELQATVNKLRGILDGSTELEAKDINELLTKHIDYIEYKRVGDHKAEIEMKIHYKGQSREQSKS